MVGRAETKAGAEVAPRTPLSALSVLRPPGRHVMTGLHFHHTESKGQMKAV
jgi:hypothetical protein